MKLQLFAAAAAVVCSMAAGSAFAADGTIEASYVNVGFAGVNLDGYSAAGSVSTGPVVGGFSLQGDAMVADIDIFDTNWAVRASALKRSSTNAYGAYLSYSDNTVFSKSYEGGFAGQLFQPNSTLSLNLGYGSAELGTSEAYWRASGGATFYVNDSLAFGVNGSYQDVDSVGVHNSEIGLSGEWLLSQLPISIVANYNSNTILGAKFNVVSVGVRHSFGAKSLKARDQGSIAAPTRSRFSF